MARTSISCTAPGTTIGAEGFGPPKQDGDPNQGATFGSTKTTFETDLATLVADGASPTQAHVTAVNTDYTAFKATFGAVLTVQDVTLIFDTSKVTSRSSLRRAVALLLAQAEAGAGGLTP